MIDACVHVCVCMCCESVLFVCSYVCMACVRMFGLLSTYGMRVVCVCMYVCMYVCTSAYVYGVCANCMLCVRMCMGCVLIVCAYVYGVCAFAGAQSVLFAKCFAELLAATIRGDGVLFQYWQTFMVLTGMVRLFLSLFPSFFSPFFLRCVSATTTTGGYSYSRRN